MSVRPISRLVTTALAAGAISVAVSGPAMARPADNFYYGASGVPTAVSGGHGHPNVTAGTDVAASDQQAPIVIAKAKHTEISNPGPAGPVAPAAPSVDSGFQWDDAGIGAGGALVIALTALGGVMVVRRRNVSDPPLAA